MREEGASHADRSKHDESKQLALENRETGLYTDRATLAFGVAIAGVLWTIAGRVWIAAAYEILGFVVMFFIALTYTLRYYANRPDLATKVYVNGLLVILWLGTGLQVWAVIDAFVLAVDYSPA
jgi:hypothetical protein